MLHPAGSATMLPRFLKTPRDLLLRVLFVVLATWPFVVGVVLLRKVLAVVF
jgi:hypothetical protein